MDLDAALPYLQHNLTAVGSNSSPVVSPVKKKTRHTTPSIKSGTTSVAAEIGIDDFVNTHEQVEIVLLLVYQKNIDINHLRPQNFCFKNRKILSNWCQLFHTESSLIRKEHLWSNFLLWHLLNSDDYKVDEMGAWGKNNVSYNIECWWVIIKIQR